MVALYKMQYICYYNVHEHPCISSMSSIMQYYALVTMVMIIIVNFATVEFVAGGPIGEPRQQHAMKKGTAY